MLWLQLINKSKDQLSAEAVYEVGGFTYGGFWMVDQLGALRQESPILKDQKHSFNKIGFLKYSACVLFGIIPMLVIGLNLVSIVLFVLLFYIAEIHFLFLFPLVIEGVADPFKANYRLVKNIGFLRCLINIVPIACYMVIGLFNFRSPLYNWYVGCLSVLILYVEETKD